MKFEEPQLRIIPMSVIETNDSTSTSGQHPDSYRAPGRVGAPAAPTTVNGVLSGVADQK